MSILVTSIPPITKRPLPDFDGDFGTIYQAQCVQSWFDAGFDVVSVNAPEEMEAISAAFPRIKVVSPKWDERERFGRPLVPISELVDALKETGTEFGGIINADIRLRRPSEIRKHFAALGPNQLAYAKRKDIRSPGDNFGRTYSFGIDVFLFDVNAVALLDLRDMTLGVPWWDYYLPLMALFGGLDLIEWPSEIAQHFWHAQKWEQSLWREYYKLFRERFEERLAAEILGDQERLSPLMLYAVTQGGYYFRHYSNECAGYDLGMTPELQPKDVDNHIVAYGYFVLDFLSKMSAKKK